MHTGIPMGARSLPTKSFASASRYCCKRSVWLWMLFSPAFKVTTHNSPAWFLCNCFCKKSSNKSTSPVSDMGMANEPKPAWYSTSQCPGGKRCQCIKAVSITKVALLPNGRSVTIRPTCGTRPKMSSQGASFTGSFSAVGACGGSRSYTWAPELHKTMGHKARAMHSRTKIAGGDWMRQTATRTRDGDEPSPCNWLSDESCSAHHDCRAHKRRPAEMHTPYQLRTTLCPPPARNIDNEGAMAGAHGNSGAHDNQLGHVQATLPERLTKAPQTWPELDAHLPERPGGCPRPKVSPGWRRSRRNAPGARQLLSKHVTMPRRCEARHRHRRGRLETMSILAGINLSSNFSTPIAALSSWTARAACASSCSPAPFTTGDPEGPGTGAEEVRAQELLRLRTPTARQSRRGCF